MSLGCPVALRSTLRKQSPRGSGSESRRYRPEVAPAYNRRMRDVGLRATMTLMTNASDRRRSGARRLQQAARELESRRG